MSEAFERILGLMGGAANAQRAFIDAFHAGADAARKGSNQANSHYSWFCTKEQSLEWDRGFASVRLAQPQDATQK